MKFDLYKKCLEMVGLSLERAANPEDLPAIHKANLKWAQEFVLDNTKAEKEPPLHWHSAFKKEKLTEAEWISAWNEPIPDDVLPADWTADVGDDCHEWGKEDAYCVTYRTEENDGLAIGNSVNIISI